MKKIIVLGAMLGLLTAGSAMALPINVRTGPVIPGVSSGSELSVQSILNSHVNQPSGYAVGAPAYVDALTSQSKVAVWTPSDGSTSTSYLVSLFTAHSNGQFGIYSYTDPAKEWILINRQASSTARQATFSIEDGNLIRTNDNGDVLTLVSDFGTSFGFFWRDTVEGYTSYTEDSKNSGVAQALTYQLSGGSRTTTYNGATTNLKDGDDWIMTFEDHRGADSDYDYNDATFLVQDIAPVPEPGTMMLLGAGFLGLAIYGKRRKNA